MRSFNHEGSVEVDGETLHLVCNFRAIDVIESVTGQKMSEILPQLMDPPFALLGKVVWGLLREKHEDITLDQAAAIAFSDSPQFGLVMGDVLRRAFNIGEAKADPPKRRGTSKSS
jgi:hypothetical protein